MTVFDLSNFSTQKLRRAIQMCENLKRMGFNLVDENTVSAIRTEMLFRKNTR